MTKILKLKIFISINLSLIFFSFLFNYIYIKEENKKKSSLEVEEEAGEPKRILKIWSLSDELVPVARDYEKKFPDVKVEYRVIPNESFQSTLKSALKRSKDVPDVYVGEFGYVRDWVEDGNWDILTNPPYNFDPKNITKYVLDVGTDKNGDLRGISWQATPGGIFYKRSIAKEIFGTDDPNAIAELFSSFDKILETGEILKKRSGLKYTLFSGINELFWIFNAKRQMPWIVGENNEFIIQDEVKEYFEFSKKIREEGLDAKISSWSPAWYDSMKKGRGVFAFVLPTWGLHYLLKDHASDMAGDYAVVPAPVSFFWGGTWLGIYKKSNIKQDAWNFVNMLAGDEEYLEYWAKKTGDFLSNQKVVEKIKDSIRDDYLKEQNHYLFFKKELEKINGGILSPYDTIINTMIQEIAASYVNNENIAKDLDSALKLVYRSVYNAIPEVTIAKEHLS